jgi:hypothetical protein
MAASAVRDVAAARKEVDMLVNRSCCEEWWRILIRVVKNL